MRWRSTNWDQASTEYILSTRQVTFTAGAWATAINSVVARLQPVQLGNTSLTGSNDAHETAGPSDSTRSIYQMHQDWDEEMRFGASSNEEMASDLESEADIISRDDSSCKGVLTFGSSSYCI